MNHDDVIRLAKEAGLYVGKNASGVTLVGHKYQRFDNTGMLVHMDVKDMAKFAELVAAAEREAIVKLVWNTPQADDEYVCHKDTITKAIRARGGV